MKIKTALIQLVRRPRHRLSRFTRPAVALAICLAAAPAIRAQTPVPPLVTGVTAVQQAGTNLVNITYAISDANFTRDNVFILVSQDSGATWNVPALTFTGAYGTNISVNSTPTGESVVWNAGVDWPGNFSTNCRVRVLANNLGLVLIPPGSYQRGDNLDAETDAPVYPVNVSAFYIDTTLVTGGKWNLVVGAYASSHGYTFDNPGSFKAVNHPVQNVNWYDAVKWCNARSQMEGVTPCYYTNVGLTALYTNGDWDSVYVNTNANGYRLPTEAEWEKAARGGATGYRFPWTNVATISESQANYDSDTNYVYDLGPFGFNSIYATGAQPYTSPVGSFAPNGYGLSDMAGNVFEFCWDWYSANSYTAGQTNPQGPSTPQDGYRVVRGGMWESSAYFERCASRYQQFPANPSSQVGFRCVRGQP
jgi:sulfatase modifying factor 1